MNQILFIFALNGREPVFHNLLNHAQGTQELPEGAERVLNTGVLLQFPKCATLFAQLVVAAHETGIDYKVYPVGESLDFSSNNPQSN